MTPPGYAYQLGDGPSAAASIQEMHSHSATLCECVLHPQPHTVCIFRISSIPDFLDMWQCCNILNLKIRHEKYTVTLENYNENAERKKVEGENVEKKMSKTRCRRKECRTKKSRKKKTSII
jgi:hypothetical protein